MTATIFAPAETVAPRSTADRPKDRFIGIDCLRGLAALAVLLFHYTIDYPAKFGWVGGGAMHFAVPVGSMGVRTFFTISGFVILMSLDRARSPAAFAISRVARLYPAFLAAMVLTFALVTLTGYNPRNIAAIDLPYNITFSATFFGRDYIDAPYWTLTREFYFYMLLGIVYFSIPRTRMAEFVIAWCLASALWNVTGADQNFYSHLTSRSILSIVLNTQFAYLFGLGMIVYEAFKGCRSPALFAAAVVACGTAGVAEWPVNGQVFAWGQVARAVGYLSIVALAALPRRSHAILRPFVFLGAISYSVYLVHETIGYWIIATLQSRGAPPSVAIAVAVVAVIALAVVLRNWIEVPGQRLIKAQLVRLSPRGAKA